MADTVVQPGAGLTAKIINPVLSSVIETFGVMMDCRVDRGAAELRQPGDRLYEISALIGISGRAKGLVCISFQRQTAFGVIERFLGDEIDEITPEVTDALGEIANMVGGSAKSKMDMGLNIGLPMVVHGKDQVIEFPTESKTMRVHFDSDIGPFLVDFGFVVRKL